MLIKRAVLDRVVAGEIDLIYRHWRKPTVVAGGTLRTSVGMLEIIAIDPVVRSRITAADAARAGYETRAALLRDLDQRDGGTLYRIEVRLGGADPRIELRERAELTPDELDDLVARLDRLDRASAVGPWTRGTLLLLADHPQVRAQDLAELVGRDKPSFKRDVSKLKALGLTISHSPGYEVSPRGRRLLTHLRETEPHTPVEIPPRKGR
jgi:hypothetical protein